MTNLILPVQERRFCAECGTGILSGDSCPACGGKTIEKVEVSLDQLLEGHALRGAPVMTPIKGVRPGSVLTDMDVVCGK